MPLISGNAVRGRFFAVAQRPDRTIRTKPTALIACRCQRPPTNAWSGTSRPHPCQAHACARHGRVSHPPRSDRSGLTAASHRRPLIRVRGTARQELGGLVRKLAVPTVMCRVRDMPVRVLVRWTTAEVDEDTERGGGVRVHGCKPGEVEQVRGERRSSPAASFIAANPWTVGTARSTDSGRPS